MYYIESRVSQRCRVLSLSVTEMLSLDFFLHSDIVSECYTIVGAI